MIAFPELAGLEINLPLLIFLGLGAGILSGFAGVGGAFVVMPALVILGFPVNLAVGTSLAWVMGQSVLAVLRHGKLGNVDMKLGLVITVAAMGGVEVGVRMLDWVHDIGWANEVVLSISTALLFLVGGYTLRESLTRKRQLDEMLNHGDKLPPPLRATLWSRRLQRIHLPPRLYFARSQVTTSLWVILAVGFFVGMVSGLIGVGGGFIMVPSLVYLVGLPSFIAVGTDLFQIVFAAAYGSVRHTMNGNVIIFAAFVMVIASSIGVPFGVLVTRFVRGVSVRLVLSLAILIFAFGTTLKLAYVLTGKMATWLDTGSVIVTFGSLGLTVLTILVLFFLVRRCRAGQKIPGWCESLVTTTDET